MRALLSSRFHPIAYLSCLTLVVAAACSGPQELAPPSSTAVTPPALAKPSPLVSVMTVAPPSGFVLDGNLQEWGSLVPAPPPGPAGSSPPAAGAWAAAAASGVEVPSHVAVAVAPSGVTLAAELAGASRDGIWVGVAFQVPELPPVSYDTVRSGFVCDTDLRGEAAPADLQKECQEAETAYERFAGAHAARFQRFFRLDRNGIAELLDGGKLGPVAGAATSTLPAAAAAADAAVTVEATLPLSALPRSAGAPLTHVRLFALAATAPRPPDLREEQWTSAKLPAPFAPGPAPRLLKHLFEQAITYGDHLAASYAPGDPMDTEVVEYVAEAPGRALRRVQKRLFSPAGTFGEVSLAAPFFGNLVTLRGGDLVCQTNVANAPPENRIQRDGKLFVLDPVRATIPAQQAGDEVVEREKIRAWWHVAAILPDGTCSEGLIESPDNLDWAEVETFHSASFDALGLRGVPLSPEAAGGNGKVTGRSPGKAAERREITWRYDGKKGAYQPTTKKLPGVTKRR